MADQAPSIFEPQVPQEPQNPAPTPATPTAQEPPSVTPESIFGDLLSAIKNERGEQKYDSVPKALEGLQHSQSFIAQLKQESETLRQELEKVKAEMTKRESVEDVVARLTASQGNPATPESVLDEQKAAALFERMLQETRTKESLESNVKSVQQELVSKFGSSEAAQKAVVQKAQALGTTPEEIGKLSAQNPKMVLELFNSVQRAHTGAPPTPSVNTDSFLGTPPKDDGLQKPEKSLLAGATYKEQLEYLKKIREDVYKRHGIES